MRAIERAWYDPKQVWIWLLVPFMLLFAVISAVRRFLYRTGVLQSYKIDAPVIVVGNISVGGNGKTPMVLYLCDLLRQQGYYPGVLSRGYGGKSKHYPLQVTVDSDSAEVGDEPKLIAKHVNCPVVVDPNRKRGAEKLINDLKCNVVICDDGLQHYKLARDIEVVVIDGQRRHGNNQLMPVGPLREGEWRLDCVDFIINNGGPIRNGEYLMSFDVGRAQNVKYPNVSQPLSNFVLPVVAAAGIGNPQRFFNTLTKRGIKVKDTKAFKDHHEFKASDLPDETVFMTEKDAVKCTEFASDQWWYLPVSANLTPEFNQAFLAKVKALK